MQLRIDSVMLGFLQDETIEASLEIAWKKELLIAWRNNFYAVGNKLTFVVVKGRAIKSTLQNKNCVNIL